MKKSLIALAVAAGSIAAAQADTTNLYGSLGFSSVVSQASVDPEKKDDLKGLVKSVGSTTKSALNGLKDNHWDIATTTARIGVKGTEDLNNGLQAFFKFEFGAGESDGLSSTNYAYLGLKGDFGTLTIGRQQTLLKVVTDTGLFQEVGIGYNYAKSMYADAGYPGTQSKVISYVSPESGGLQIGASVMADGDKYNSLNADAWEVAAMYKQNGFDTGVVYTRVAKGKPYNDNGTVKVQSQGAQEFIGLNVGYSNDQFGAVGRAVHQSSVGTEYGLEGEYYSGPNTFRAGIGMYDPKAAGAENVYNAALGYQYNFSKRTYTWVEGQYTDYNQDNIDNGFKALVGIRHDF